MENCATNYTSAKMTWMQSENVNSNADANMPVAWSSGSLSNDGMKESVHHHFRREARGLAKDAWIQTPPRQDAKLLRAQTGKWMIQPSKPRLQQPTNSPIGAKIP